MTDYKLEIKQRFRQTTLLTKMRFPRSVVLLSVMPEILLVQAESELALQSAMANGLQFSLVQFQTQP